MELGTKKKLAFALAAVFLIWLGCKSVANSLDERTQPDGKVMHCSDFYAFYAGAIIASDGKDIYKAKNYIALGTPRVLIPYPPSFFIFISPLALLPHEAAAVLWCFISIACLAGMMELARRLLAIKDKGAGFWVFLIAFALFARFLINNMRNGEINLIIAFILYLFLYFHSRKKSLAAGFFLALAVALKVTPAIFFIYLAWKRRFKDLAFALASLAVLMALLPVLYFGASSTAKYYKRWYGEVARAGVTAEEARYTSVEGHCITSVLRNLISRVNVGKLGHEPMFVNAFSLDAETAAVIIKLALLAVLALGLLFLKVPRGEPGGPLAAYEFSIMILLMLLLSPLTRTAHIVVIFLPYAAALRRIFEAKGAPAANAGFNKFFLWSFVAAMLLTHFSKLLPLGEWFDTAVGIPLLTLGNFLLLVMLGLALSREARRKAADASPPPPER